jgi:hypothetical protein
MRELHVQEWILGVIDVFGEKLHKLNTARKTWLEKGEAEMKTGMEEVKATGSEAVAVY